MILSNNAVEWAAISAIIAGLGLLGASTRNIWRWLTKNRVDRLQMYVDLTNDLQSEIKRLREERDKERHEFAAQLKELQVEVEHLRMETQALRADNEKMKSLIDANPGDHVQEPQA